MDLDMTTRQLYNADLGSFVVFCSTLNIDFWIKNLDVVNSSPSLTFVNVIEVALPFEKISATLPSRFNSWCCKLWTLCPSFTQLFYNLMPACTTTQTSSITHPVFNVESILRMFYYSWSMEYDTTGSHTGCEVNLTRRSQELLMLSYVTLCWRVMNVELVLLNCRNCNQCLKGHRSLGLLFQGALWMSLSFCWSGQVSS